MYDHTLHRRRNYFCCYCLKAFSTKKLLKSHAKGFFKINGKFSKSLSFKSLVSLLKHT